MANNTRNIFSLSEYSDSTIAGDGVPVPSVWMESARADNAWVGGGYPGSTIMDKLTYATDGVSRVPSADINLEYGSNAAPISSAGAGYFVAGNAGLIGNTPSIDRRSYVRKLTYATETISTTSNPVAQSPSTNGQGPQGQGGASSPNFGYTGGGSGGGGGDEKSWVQKMSFATEGWTALPNLPSAIHYQGDALGNEEAGYWCGGSPGVRTMVQKVTYSSDTTSRSPSSDLVSPGRYFSGAGNADAGYLMGRGSSPTVHSNIFKFTYSTETTSLHPSNMPQAMKQSRGTGNYSKGYSAAGTSAPGPWVSSISKLDYSTGTPSTISNKMTAGARMDVLAVSAKNNGITLPAKQTALRWIDDKVSGSGYAVEFHGDNDYLSIPTSSDYDIGTGDFTIECWMYADTLVTSSHSKRLFAVGPSNADGFAIRIDASGNVQVAVDNTSVVYSGNGGVTTSEWTHVALCRASSVMTLYINGEIPSGTATATVSTDIDKSNGTFQIGANHDSPSTSSWNGKITNFRYVKGQALYTSSFTAPTSPLTTTSQGATASNVKLLCCNTSTTTGSIVTPGTITANGDVNTATQSVIAVRVPAATPTSSTTTIPNPSLLTVGYWSGGYAGGGNPGMRSITDRLTFATDTTSRLPGSNTPSVKHWASGSSSATKGYSSGGYEGWENPRTSNIYSLTYASGTWATAATLGDSRGKTASINSLLYSWTGGGGSSDPASYTSKIDRLTFATEPPSKNILQAANPFQWATGVGNNLAGYFCNGKIDTQSGTTIVEKLTYSTDSIALTPGLHVSGTTNLGSRVNSTMAFGTGDVGYIMGGRSPNRSTVNKITFSTDTRSLGGPLWSAVHSGSGLASASAGYLTGQEPGTTSDAYKMPFATETWAYTGPANASSTSGQQKTGFGAGMNGNAYPAVPNVI